MRACTEWTLDLVPVVQLPGERTSEWTTVSYHVLFQTVQLLGEVGEVGEKPWCGLTKQVGPDQIKITHPSLSHMFTMTVETAQSFHYFCLCSDIYLCPALNWHLNPAGHIPRRASNKGAQGSGQEEVSAG